jgi:general secretion pathway protein K
LKAPLRASHRDLERGVAILTAMIVVTIGTVLAVNMMWQSTLDQRRTASALAADEALMFALGAEAWAADILQQDLVDSPDSDHLGEIWAMELAALPIEGGVIGGRLEDLQGRFNLNNLVTEEGEEDELVREQFERLLATLGLDMGLAGAVVDWLDPDVDVHFPTGAEDSTYTALDPAYRTANSMITSPSELMAVSGFDRETYQVLAPYVTALPRGTRLNVNTASDVLLASLSDDIDLSLAGSLIEERAGADFTDVETTFADLIAPEMFAKIDGVTEHFLLTGTVVIGSNQMTLRSVLQRDSSGLTRALFRSFGVE